jgi:hypothetical protein
MPDCELNNLLVCCNHQCQVSITYLFDLIGLFNSGIQHQAINAILQPIYMAKA